MFASYSLSAVLNIGVRSEGVKRYFRFFFVPRGTFAMSLATARPAALYSFTYASRMLRA
jgi:hypothetical protein